jgi:hypothetical protein
MLTILNVAERSLLQATPKPRYGSGALGVEVKVAVAVGIGVAVFVEVGVGVEVAVLATAKDLTCLQEASAVAVSPGCPGRWLITIEIFVPG